MIIIMCGVIRLRFSGQFERQTEICIHTLLLSTLLYRIEHTNTHTHTRTRDPPYSNDSIAKHAQPHSLLRDTNDVRTYLRIIIIQSRKRFAISRKIHSMQMPQRSRLLERLSLYWWLSKAIALDMLCTHTHGVRFRFVSRFGCNDHVATAFTMCNFRRGSIKSSFD